MKGPLSHVGHCPNGGKRQYRTRLKAIRATRPYIRVRAYKCPACGYWHVTSQPFQQRPPLSA